MRRLTQFVDRVIRRGSLVGMMIMDSRRRGLKRKPVCSVLTRRRARAHRSPKPAPPRSSAARLTERPPPQCNMGPRRGSFRRCRGPLRRLGPRSPRASKRRRRSWFSELLIPCARTVSPPSAASFLCVFSFPAQARRARRDKERPCFLWPARTWVVCFLPGGPERAR